MFEHYTTTTGKRTDRRAVFREARFAFEGTGGARLDLVVRVSSDGVAYQYGLAVNYGAVLGESSAYRLAATSPAWLATYSVYRS